MGAPFKPHFGLSGIHRAGRAAFSTATDPQVHDHRHPVQSAVELRGIPLKPKRARMGHPAFVVGREIQARAAPYPEKRHRDKGGTAHAGRPLRSIHQRETATYNPCKPRLAQAPHQGRWLAILQFAPHKLYVSAAVFGCAFTLRRPDRPFAWRSVRKTSGTKVNLPQSHDL
jgi:hypothetical protein